MKTRSVRGERSVRSTPDARSANVRSTRRALGRSLKPRGTGSAIRSGRARSEKLRSPRGARSKPRGPCSRTRGADRPSGPCHHVVQTLRGHGVVHGAESDRKGVLAKFDRRLEAEGLLQSLHLSDDVLTDEGDDGAGGAGATGATGAVQVVGGLGRRVVVDHDG